MLCAFAVILDSSDQLLRRPSPRDLATGSECGSPNWALSPVTCSCELHVGDTWGFQELRRENLVRGMVRVKGKERAMKLLAGSGRCMKGQVWFVDPIRWDMFATDAPRMVWIDQKPGEPDRTFAKRVASDAGTYGLARGTVQVAVRVPPTDKRIGPRLATE